MKIKFIEKPILLSEIIIDGIWISIIVFIESQLVPLALNKNLDVDWFPRFMQWMFIVYGIAEIVVFIIKICLFIKDRKHKKE